MGVPIKHGAPRLWEHALEMVRQHFALRTQLPRIAPSYLSTDEDRRVVIESFAIGLASHDPKCSGAISAAGVSARAGYLG